MKDSAQPVAADAAAATVAPVAPVAEVQVPPLSGELEFYMRPDCPHCDQVWTALTYKRMSFKITYLYYGEEKPAWFKIASPEGTIPVLRLLDGTYMDDSEDMLEWINKQPGGPSYEMMAEDKEKWLPFARKELLPCFFKLTLVPVPAVQQEFKEKLEKAVAVFTEHLKVKYRRIVAKAIS